MTDDGQEGTGREGPPIAPSDVAQLQPARSESVTLIDAENPPRVREREGSITLVGTAHVSQKSVDEVRETVDRERPDVVAVELDETRYRRMQGETPDDIDPGDVISGKTVYQFLAYWMLSYVQARLGDRFDIEPGADMMAAIEAAETGGSAVALVDRNIQTTVQRLWSRMRLREKLSILAALLVEIGGPLTAALTVGYFFGFTGAIITAAVSGQLFLPPAPDLSVPLVGGLLGTVVSVLDWLLVATLIALAVAVPLAALLSRATGDIEAEELDLEELTDADVVTAMIEEFRRFSPGGAEALIDERDAYIAQRLVTLRAAGYDVVAVVGAGHRAGMSWVPVTAPVSSAISMPPRHCPTPSRWSARAPRVVSPRSCTKQSGTGSRSSSSGFSSCSPSRAYRVSFCYGCSWRGYW